MLKVGEILPVVGIAAVGGDNSELRRLLEARSKVFDAFSSRDLPREERDEKAWSKLPDFIQFPTFYESVGIYR